MAASAVMADHGGVAINDLHAFASPRLGALQLPEDVHFTEAGSAALGEQVAQAVRQAMIGQPARLAGPTMDLRGKVAVVTGASSGCGCAIAAALEARGMVVAAVSRSSERFATDVSDTASVARLKAAVEAELGPPSVVVNAAGVFGPIAVIG